MGILLYAASPNIVAQDLTRWRQQPEGAGAVIGIVLAPLEGRSRS